MVQQRRAAENVRVLFASSEVFPLVKTGGLADVSGSLPEALLRLGVDVRLLVPGYPSVLAALTDFWHMGTAHLSLGEVRLLYATMPDSGVPVMVADCPPLFQRDGGPYQDNRGDDWPDNALRFGLFSRLAALLASSHSPFTWRPNILHCNDWQTGLAPAHLSYFRGPRAVSLFTIHNLAYQGLFPKTLVTKLGLPPEAYGIEGVEFYGQMSFLKAGLYYADHLSTVSPTYAAEIQTEALGFGMQGLLEDRRRELSGILNGIDTEEWNTVSDPYLAAPYDASSLDAKIGNKRALQKRLGLHADDHVPLLGSVGRFTHQKGLDLLLEIAPKLLDLPAQIVLIGSGDAHLEASFRRLANEYPGRVSVTIGYDETLAHLIEGGADIFLMPSRFEPCGLNQMYSMHYGTPPVVYATGGLMDTVTDLTPANHATATGFVFSDLTAEAFFSTVQRACGTWHDKKRWRQLQMNGMRLDFSWEHSGDAYLNLYQQMLQG